MMKHDKKERAKLIGEIEIAFSRLIGPLATMGSLESYKEAHEEINNLFNIVTKWSADFQLKQTLSFISRDNLLDVYYRLDALKDKFLFDSKLGNESELSDEIVIWIWAIMEMRKRQIEMENENNVGR